MSASAQRRRLLVSVVAACIAVGAVALLLTQTGALKATAPVATGTSNRGTTKVVVAALDLTPATKITSAMVTLVDFPTANVPTGAAVTSVAQAVDHYVALNVPKGAMLVGTELLASPADPTARTTPPITLKPGDVAMSIPFDEAKGAGGFVQPGDHLDILISDPSGNIHYGLQDVLILKVGGQSVQAVASAAAAPAPTGTAPVAATPPTLLLIELPREKAAVLAYLLNLNGGADVVRYLLRPGTSFGVGPLPNSAPVTPQNVLQLLDG